MRFALLLSGLSCVSALFLGCASWKGTPNNQTAAATGPFRDSARTTVDPCEAPAGSVTGGIPFSRYLHEDFGVRDPVASWPYGFGWHQVVSVLLPQKTR